MKSAFILTNNNNQKEDAMDRVFPWLFSSFALVSALSLALILSGCANMSSASQTSSQRVVSPEAAIGKAWHWEAMTTPTETIEVPNPERYTLELSPDGNAAASFDCNRGGGSYRIAEGKLSFGPFVSTQMACPPPSLGDRYAQELSKVVSFYIEGARLYLELTDHGGTMRFRPPK
jgi:heat shock protein HslJ